MKRRPNPRARPLEDKGLFGGDSWPCFVQDCDCLCHVRKDGTRPWFCDKHEAMVRTQERTAKKADIEKKKRPWRWPKLKKGEKRG